jgi:hypothetical protein
MLHGYAVQPAIKLMHLVAIRSGVWAVNRHADGRGHAVRINAEASLAVATEEVQQAQRVPPKHQATAAILLSWANGLFCMALVWSWQMLHIWNCNGPDDAQTRTYPDDIPLSRGLAQTAAIPACLPSHALNPPLEMAPMRGHSNVAQVRLLHFRVTSQGSRANVDSRHTRRTCLHLIARRPMCYLAVSARPASGEVADAYLQLRHLEQDVDVHPLHLATLLQQSDARHISVM